MHNDMTIEIEEQQLYDARQTAEIKRLRIENAQLRAQVYALENAITAERASRNNQTETIEQLVERLR